MPWRKKEKVRVQCYPGGKSILLRFAGYFLIGLGMALILLCVPSWAWLSILGAALILAGVLLAKN
ncbi:MAG: hypothetical protein IKQ41_11220 [Clostridia bacterium]|nr:hypothetical protein [Clostridia bacterium]